MITIYIPTRGRVHDQITLRNLPESILRNTTLVCDTDDRNFSIPLTVAIQSTNVKGIGAVRQYIVDYHTKYQLKKFGPKILMLDDDLRFFVRRKDDPTKFLPANDHDKEDMVSAVDIALGTYAHAGILAREGGNRKPPGVELNTRLLRALAYDVTVLNREGVRFDRLPVMEDFDVALQLLRKGYQSACLCDWVQDQTRSNAPGGCSIYRTLDVQAQGAQLLKECHKGFVSVVSKTTKTAWGGATRTDVTVAWKKAYQSSQWR